jgi:hypothetical protein
LNRIEGRGILGDFACAQEQKSEELQVSGENHPARRTDENGNRARDQKSSSDGGALLAQKLKTEAERGALENCWRRENGRGPSDDCRQKNSIRVLLPRVGARPDRWRPTQLKTGGWNELGATWRRLAENSDGENQAAKKNGIRSPAANKCRQQKPGYNPTAMEESDARAGESDRRERFHE